MANTTTIRTLNTSPNDNIVWVLVNLTSDGSEETDKVLYDNSTLINDVTRGKLMTVLASGSSCQVTLEWDQSSDSPICSFDPAYTEKIDFRRAGGVSNPAGSGATGDIVMTTANLDSGDVITLLLEVYQGV